MTFDQITAVVKVAASLGVGDFRITGGEPLMRQNLDQLISNLVQVPGVRDVALTTNGMLLSNLVGGLAASGLKRVNISLDTLSEVTFRTMSRRKGLFRVLEGIEAALSEPRIQVRLNALVLREVNLEDVVELVQFARTRGVTIRFIEFMPLDAEGGWNRKQVVSGTELRSLLAEAIGPLSPAIRPNESQPATDFQFADGSRVGFVDTVSQPFCEHCDRIRLTADGKLRNCLFGQQEWDISCITKMMTIENSGQILDKHRADLEGVMRTCVAAKARSHGIDAPGFSSPTRTMHQIGG